MNDLFSEHPEVEPLYQGRYPMTPHVSGRGHCIQLPDGDIYYAPEFFSQKIRDRLLQVLLANDRYPLGPDDWQKPEVIDWQDPQIGWQTIPWQQDKIWMYGKQLPLPRLSSWHGDDDRPYTYSGIRLQPKAWNKPLDWLRQQLLQLTGIEFNSVLLNLYRNGDDHIAWHQDDEPELGVNPVIASVNLGASRRFLLRHTKDHQQKVEFLLEHGSLLIMSGALQQHWQHSVPKAAKVKDCRINLTFRVIKT